MQPDHVPSKPFVNLSPLARKEATVSLSTGIFVVLCYWGIVALLFKINTPLGIGFLLVSLGFIIYLSSQPSDSRFRQKEEIPPVDESERIPPNDWPHHGGY
jgi:hypothetical protein